MVLISIVDFGLILMLHIYIHHQLDTCPHSVCKSEIIMYI